MKINEQVYEEGDQLIVKKTHDFTPILKQMEQIREKGIIGMGGDTSTAGETRFIGRLPVALINEWCKEEGVKWDDVHAKSELVKRKILSGDFDAFRSDWKGNY
jgi:hypothetical protein